MSPMMRLPVPVNVRLLFVLIAPATSSLYAGELVPIPTLPLGSMRMRSEPLVANPRLLTAGKNMPFVAMVLEVGWKLAAITLPVTVRLLKLMLLLLVMLLTIMLPAMVTLFWKLACPPTSNTDRGTVVPMPTLPLGSMYSLVIPLVLTATMLLEVFGRSNASCDRP